MLKIIEININNYGCLKNTNYKLNDLTTFFKDNGLGKTTLLNYIVDTLYSEYNTSYEPFDSSIISGSMKLLYNNEEYSISGTSKGKKKGKFEIHNKNNELLNINSFGDDILKIDRDIFERVFSINNLLTKEKQFTNLGSNKESTKVISSITTLLSDATGSTGAGDAINELRSKIRVLEKEKNTLLSLKVSQENEVLKKQSIIDNINGLKKESSLIDLEYERSNKTLVQISSSNNILEEFENKQNKLKEQKVLRQAILNKYQNKLISKEELDQIKVLQHNTLNKPIEYKRSINYIYLGISVFIIILSIILGIFVSPWLLFILLLSIPFIILSFNKKEEILNEDKIILDRILSKYPYEINAYSIESDYTQLDITDNNIKSLLKEIDSYQSLHEKELSNTLTVNEVSHKLTMLSAKKNEILKNIATNEATYNKVIEIEKELSNTIELYNNKVKELDMNSNLLNIMVESNESLKTKYIEPVRDNFNKYVSIFKDTSIKEYSNISINKEFEISLEKQGKVIEFDSLSDGQKSILELISKLAIADSITESNSNFIILDDPFVYLDEIGLKSCLNCLKELSKLKQIIYFTCHESRNIM